MAQRESEVEFHDRLRAGDRSAFEAVVREYGGRMRVVALRLLRNDADADEVVQEAFLAAFCAVGRFRGEAGVMSWLHRIVLNSALMRLRSAPEDTEELPEDLFPHFMDNGAIATQVPWPDGPLDEVLRAEACTEVRACIDQLPASIRIAVILRDMEGLSYEETAGQLGGTVNASKLRVHRGRQAVRTMLERRFERTV